MSKLSFRARALDASKPMPIYLAEELPDLPDYSAINRAVPQMPSGMEKEEESEHHLQRAISGTGLIIPTPEVCDANDLEFYERCYPPDYKMPKQHIHMQPLWEEQEAPEYDIDSEDERWLKQQRHPELTELLFEQMMDKLEKCSGQTVVTLSEAKLLLERKDDLVIAVYDYWLNKRLNTQHPLILAVKTESRPGQSSNNPYLAFRRRTEKMQTRKNRKNDESSYEKMLKLRRDLARALTLLQLVARREEAKRDLLRLTARLADRRYAAGDFANQLLPDPPPRPQYTLTVGNGVGIASLGVRREPQLQHFTPRLTPQPVDQRQREKRPYKRRRKHQVVGSVPGLRDSTSEEESAPRTEPASPPDDGPFSFRRKQGCFYEMPTTTLCGDPVDPDNPNGLFEHELDERHRYTLTSISHPYPKCVGFARRRLARGGRVVLDRVQTPLDDLWPKLQFQHVTSSRYRRDREEEVEFETKAHRNPMELSRDYHTSGKHPWRRPFRQHLSKNPHLWLADDRTDSDDVKMDVDPDDVKLCADDVRLCADDVKLCTDDVKLCADDVKLCADDVKLCADDVKLGVDDVKLGVEDVKMEIDKSDLPQDSDISDVRTMDVSDDSVRHGLDSAVKENLGRVLRKRAYSGCSDDSSYDSDESLHPVEKEFEKFITEVNRKWLHFRPKTPPPSPPPPPEEGLVALAPDTPFQVELQPLSPPSHGLDVFTTAPFTLSDLYPDVEADVSGNSLDVSGDDILGENLGLTDAQVESILSETDLKALDADLKDKKIAEDILDELVRDVDVKDSFLSQGQSSGGRSGSGARRARLSLGSSAVSVRPEGAPPVHVPAPAVQVKPEPPEKVETPKAVKSEGLDRIERAETKSVSPRRTERSGQVKQSQTGQNVKSSHTGQNVKGQTVKISQIKPLGSISQIRPLMSQETKVEVSMPSPVPTSKIIVEEVNEVPQQMRMEKKKSVEQAIHEDTRPSTPMPTVPRTPITVSVSLPTSGINLPPGIKKTTAVSSPARRGLQDHHHPQILTVAVSDHLKVRLQNHLVSSTASGSPQVVGVVQNGPFVALPVQQRDGTGVTGVSVASTSSPRRLSAPLVHLAPALTHKQLQIHPSQQTHTIPTHPPVVVAQSHTIHHVAPNKLKVLHAHPLTQTQRTQLLAQNRSLTQLPAVVSLATLGEAKTSNTALLKTSSGSVTQFFEIKSGQLGKGPHLVNVVRQPQPVKPNVARIDLNDAKKRQVVAAFDGTLKGNVQAVARPHRVNVNLDGRQIVRAALPSVRAPHVRHQIQLKNRTFQMAQPIRATSEPSTSITVAAPTKTASIPSSVVANLLQKNVQIPKSGQKIAISGAAGQLAANVQAIAFTTAQLKARQARLIAQPRPTPVSEIVESSTAIPSSSASSLVPEAPETPEGEDGATNGVRRRRPTEPLMEVT